MSTARINLKLKIGAEKKASLSRLSRVFGVVKVRKMFPQETDPDLAGLYIATTAPRNVARVLTIFSADKDVEFAQKMPTQKASS